LETSPTPTTGKGTRSTSLTCDNGYGCPVHVVIMGCGRVGSTLARSLEDRNHTVSVIDSEPDAFRRLGPGFNGDKVTGYGFDQAVLEKAGIRRADAFAAVSSGDNSNIIAARVARETFGIQQVVARIYDPGRAEVYQRLGITTVATVKWTADQVLRRLLPAGAEPDFRDPSGTIRLDQVPIPESWVGERTVVFQERTRTRIAWIDRLGEGMLPSRETMIQEGDLLHLVMREEDAAKVFQVIEAGPTEEHG
jgi:trk system potassium uptake protein TrkA